MLTKFSILTWVVPVFLLSSVLTAQQGNECTLVGEVHTPGSDFPGKRILVNLETRGATMGSAYTDSEGRFQFLHLESNLYHVVVNDDDYLPVRISVALASVTNPYSMVRIDLVPRTDPRAATAQPASLGANAHANDSNSNRTGGSGIAGGNPYMANWDSLAKQFPTKALKEFQHGVSADEKRHTDEAITHYQRALKIAPEFYPARNNLGSDYLNQGKLDAAAGEFEYVEKNSPTDAAAHFNSANVFLLTRRYQESLEHVMQGLAREPSSAFGYLVLGSAFLGAGDTKQAERALHRALELDPKMSRAHLALVNLYLQQNRGPEAIVELQTYLKAFPDSPFSPKARDLLKRLQETTSVQPR